MDLNNLNEIVEQSNNNFAYGKQTVSSPISPYSVDNLDELVFGDGGDDELQSYGNTIQDDRYVSAYDAKTDQERMLQAIPENKVKTSRLPDAIKESLLTHHIDLSAVDASKEFTERLAKHPGIEKAAALFKQINEGAEKVENEKTEEIRNNNIAPRTNANANVGGISYETIKNLINDAVKTNIDSLKKELINEKSLYVMKIGRKFLLMDNEENIFECNLEFKKKNKRKK